MSERNDKIQAIQNAMMGAEIKLSVGDINQLAAALNDIKDEEEKEDDE